MRQSLTCLTSTWSDGTAGPLGICVPESFMTEDAIQAFNQQWPGQSYIFSSQSKSHFMNGQSLMDVLHNLIGAAFKKQRAKWKLSDDDKGLLLADGWTGFHGQDTETSRQAWSQQHGVFLPEVQPGGFSANAQPVDQVHHLLRSRLELTDSDSVGCNADMAQRASALVAFCFFLDFGFAGYSDMAIRPNGQPQRPKAHNETLPLRTVQAWPRRAFIAAWIATGYFTQEHFVEDGMERDEAIALLDPSGMLVKMGIPSEQIVQSLDTNRWFWAITTADGKFALLPNMVALHVEKHICSHRRRRKTLVDKKPQGWENKLIKVNDTEMAFVYNRKAGCMATSKFMKTRTTIIDGSLQVMGNAKAYEVIRINFELDPSAGDNPDGSGGYYLSSANFERSRLCCVKSSEAPSGWDLLKQAYAGDDEIESGQG
eukprot:s4195_g5.t1